MTACKPKHLPRPRPYSATQAAARLNMSPGHFRARLPALLEAGFPRYDELLEGYDSVAIERWLDRRAGLAATFASERNAEYRGVVDGRAFLQLARLERGHGQDGDPLPADGPAPRRPQG